VIYNDKYKKPFITLISEHREIKNVETNEIIKGYYKQSYWVYNTINVGIYEEIG